jgi:hypothetical protein
MFGKHRAYAGCHAIIPENYIICKTDILHRVGMILGLKNESSEEENKITG